MNGKDEVKWPQKPIDPWKTINFSKKSVPKKWLDLSFNDVKLQTEDNEAIQENLGELKRFVKMQFDTLEQLPMGLYLKMAEELSKLVDTPFNLPQFPPQPSKNIVDAYIKHQNLGNENRSESEKMELFKIESNNVRVILDTLRAWKTEVETFVESVAAFKSCHQKSLNDEQNLKIINMEVRAKKSIPQINDKIAAKEKELEIYVLSFENFHDKMKDDQQYVGMEQHEIRNAIREIWNNTDESIRRCFAKPTRHCATKYEIVEVEQPSSSQSVVLNKQKRKLLEDAIEPPEQNDVTPKRSRKSSKKMEEYVAEKQEKDENSNARNLAKSPNRIVLKSILKKSPYVTKL